MPALGPRSLMDIAGLTDITGVDAATVLRFQMQDGLTAEEIVADAIAAIGVVNEELAARYGGFWTLTQSPNAYYRQGNGARTMTPKRTEYTEADAVRGGLIGHMLPLEDYHDAVAWTPLYLRRANRRLTDADIRLIAERWRDRVDYEVITRMLSKTETQIGEAGYTVPWAMGSGANVNYIPPAWRGYNFDSTHTHFLYVNSSTEGQDHGTLIENMQKELLHHGHTNRMTAIVSDVDVETYRALERFVKIEAFAVQAGGTAEFRSTQGEVSGIPGQIFGYYQTARGVVELRYHERFPTGYAFMSKSYGVDDPRNGLAVREEQGVGFGLTVRPKITDDIHPQLSKIVFEATHGVAVNERTNGVAGYVGAGASEYPEPTVQ